MPQSTEKGLAAPTPAGGENGLNEKKFTRADTKASGNTAVSQALPFAPHTAASSKVLEALSSDADKGLSDQDAAKRLEQYGPNRLKPPKRPSVWKIIGRQFANAMCLVLSKSELWPS
jgi:magnesium-transporting ATPase (P-type)